MKTGFTANNPTFEQRVGHPVQFNHPAFKHRRRAVGKRRAGDDRAQARRFRSPLPIAAIWNEIVVILTFQLLKLCEH